VQEQTFMDQSKVVQPLILKGAWANSKMVDTLKTETDKPFENAVKTQTEVKTVKKVVVVPKVDFNERLKLHTDRLVKNACLSEDDLLVEYQAGNDSVVLKMDVSNDVIEQVEGKEITKSRILNSKDFKERVYKYYTDLECADVRFRRPWTEKQFLRGEMSLSEVKPVDKQEAKIFTITILFEKKQRKTETKRKQDNEDDKETSELVLLTNGFAGLVEEDC